MDEKEKRERKEQLEKERESAITVLRASAGSGKTYNLAYRFVRRILRNPELFHEILAVTFTNKATCQMKEKILESIDSLKTDPGNDDYSENLMFDLGIPDTGTISRKAATAQMDILADYDRFAVSTIDKFFSKIVRSFFNELGKDPSYEVVTSVTELIDKAIVDVISDGENYEILLPLFEQRTNEHGNNSDIKEDLGSIREAIFKLHDCKFDVDSIRRQLEDDKATVDKKINEISSKAKAILSYLLPKDGPTIEDYRRKKTGFVGILMKIDAKETDDHNMFHTNSYFDKVVSGEESPDAPKGGYKQYIESITDKLLSDLAEIYDLIQKFNEKCSKMANTVEVVGQKVNMLETIDVIYRKYTENCQKDNVVAISEMPAIVGNVAANADLVFLYMKIGILLTSIMIDEFQDTSKEQWEGFRPILEEICSHIEGPENLIIGDIKQAIYRWRGGDEKLLRKEVSEQFKTYDHPLKENYRSLKEVIEFNNDLYDYIAENGIRPDNIVFEGKEQILGETCHIISETYKDATQTAGNADRQSGGYVECISESAENITGTVIRKIMNEIIPQGFSWRDIAIVTRENSEAANIADALASAGIPFFSGESLLLTNSPFVRKIVTLMHMAIDPSNEVIRTIYNSLRISLVPDMEKLAVVTSMPEAKAIDFLAREFGIDISEMEKGEGGDLLCVREISALMRIAADPTAKEPLDEYRAICMEKLTEPIKQETIQKLAEASTMPLIEAVPYIQETMDLYPGAGETAFADYFMGIVYNKYKEAFSVADFVSWWNNTGKNSKLSSSEGQNAVCIITIHKSKGLEYPIVIVPYLDWKFTPKSKSMMLFQADSESPYHKFGTLPLDYSEERLFHSDFKEAYLTEIQQSIIDNLNLLYVTTTRAKERLYLICPEKPQKQSIAHFVTGFLAKAKKTVWGTQEGKKSSETESKEIINVNDINPTPFMGTLTSGTIFASESNDPKSVKKFRGILMHEALSKISSLDELKETVDHLCEIHGIGNEQFVPMIDKILKRPEVRDWFSPECTVYTERGILIPGKSFIRKPDRVVIKGTAATVIDYKFGEIESDTYTDQVEEYMSLIWDMGYSDVRGYIYYVVLDKIVPCGLS